tara:strand:- start:690 stop:1547 length:858 start_codon:yes stop_codon:yes gene_type:complete
MSNANDNCNSGSELPLYAVDEMVNYQYVAIPWPNSFADPKYYVAQILYANGTGDNHVFVLRYSMLYLNFPNNWRLERSLDKEDLAILAKAKIFPTGREAVYKGLVTLEDNILLINITPVQMRENMKLIYECNLIRLWCPLGACIPIDAPVVLRQARYHGGLKSRGIFASEDIPGNLIIGEYRGKVEILPPGYLFETKVSCFVLDAGQLSEELNYFIVADKIESSAWTRFINMPNLNETPNVIFDTHRASIDHPKIKEDFCVLVQTVRDIKKGEQLLVNYKCTQHH